jgi:hypothetical protein
MAGKRKSSRRSSGRGRSPRHYFHAVVKTLREITTPGRHRTGDRTLSARRRRNPWPKCQACFHRRPPSLFCAFCGNCQPCCNKCEKCGECVLNCSGHDKADSTGPDAH